MDKGVFLICKKSPKPGLGPPIGICGQAPRLGGGEGQRSLSLGLMLGKISGQTQRLEQRLRDQIDGGRHQRVVGPYDLQVKG